MSRENFGKNAAVEKPSRFHKPSGFHRGDRSDKGVYGNRHGKGNDGGKNAAHANHAAHRFNGHRSRGNLNRKASLPSIELKNDSRLKSFLDKFDTAMAVLGCMILLIGIALISCPTAENRSNPPEGVTFACANCGHINHVQIPLQRLSSTNVTEGASLETTKCMKD